jgi:hypothetical protein
MEIGGQILHTLRINRHQVGDFSQRPRLSFRRMQHQSLVVDCHHHGTSYPQARQVALEKVVSQAKAHEELRDRNRSRQGKTPRHGGVGVSQKVNEAIEYLRSDEEGGIVYEFEKSGSDEIGSEGVIQCPKNRWGGQEGVR